MPRALGAILLLPALAWPLASAKASPGFSAAAELEAGGGYDDNVFLSSVPDANTGPLRLGGPMLELAPAAELTWVGGSYRLELAYLGDYRVAEDVGHLYYQELALALSPPEVGPLRCDLGLVGGRFDASGFGEDRFWFGGGQAGVRLALKDSLRLLASYRFEARSLPATGAGDRLHFGDARLSYRPLPLVELAPRVSYLVILSPEGADFRRLRAGLDATLVWQRWKVAARGWVGPLSAPAESGFYSGAQIEIRREVHINLDLRLAGYWAAPLSGDSSSYAGRSLVLGVVLHGTTVPAVAHTRQRDELSPVVEQGRVRFRMRAPQATEVAVLGSWNDWATPGAPLRQTRDAGLWELWLPLPPGSHHYHFMVDGQATRPPDAPRYIADGFGGEDGVIEVGVSVNGVVSSPPTGSYVR